MIPRREHLAWESGSHGLHRNLKVCGNWCRDMWNDIEDQPHLHHRFVSSLQSVSAGIKLLLAQELERGVHL